ncbi:hypothetical protein AVEN_209227-1 [Araneus ventricosus]|uniref:Uncharacterized protein n=1 Tax=Araneus ventricosus TaxID=182803 RepID=A0A4Y2LZQ1_ARAVE|nr:hypothetical protein AVEN_209227-1 [Araneus ventricosus]
MLFGDNKPDWESPIYVASSQKFPVLKELEEKSRLGYKGLNLFVKAVMFSTKHFYDHCSKHCSNPEKVEVHPPKTHDELEHLILLLRRHLKYGDENLACN